jgi:dihydrodipicolinate synthase/N-acetylneuraminate lyase
VNRAETARATNERTEDLMTATKRESNYDVVKVVREKRSMIEVSRERRNRKNCENERSARSCENVEVSCRLIIEEVAT